MVDLPIKGQVPGFDGHTDWHNSAPLTAADLRGKGRSCRFLDLRLHQLASHDWQYPVR